MKINLFWNSGRARVVLGVLLDLSTWPSFRVGFGVVSLDIHVTRYSDSCFGDEIDIYLEMPFVGGPGLHIELAEKPAN